MFNKNVKEDIGKLSQSVDELKASHKEHSNKISGLTEAFNKMGKINSDFNKSISAEIEKIAELKKSFETELNSFNFLKDRIKKELIENFKDNIKREFNSLNEESIKHFELKKDINESANLLKNFNTNISKLNTISNSIKEADFELAKHFENIENTNRDKVELMKEVDRLRGILAKYKRER